VTLRVKMRDRKSFVLGAVIFPLIIFLYPGSMVLAVPFVNYFRCGPNIVGIGDTKPEVLKDCGEPTSKEVVATDERGYFYGDGFPGEDKPSTPGVYRGITRKVEEWYYNCGANNFSYLLIFEGSLLKRIEQIGYGRGQSDCLGAKSSKTDSFPLGEELVEKLRRLSYQLGTPVDDLLQEAVDDLLKKYNGR
jgi:hypothetical protein